MKADEKSPFESQSIARLTWAARRGMLELDLILSPYIGEPYLHSSDDEKKEFHALLACEDQDLFDWLVKDKPAGKCYQAMVEKVLKVKLEEAKNQAQDMRKYYQRK